MDWTLGKESKQIGNYTCFRATTFIPTDDLLWYSFSWSRMRTSETQDSVVDENKKTEVDVTQIEAWYTPQIPVRHGPSEYWGLPGLILEVSAGATTMLCSKLVINPDVSIEIEAPKKGTVVTKNEYQDIIQNKMAEFRNNRMGRR